MFALSLLLLVATPDIEALRQAVIAKCEIPADRVVIVLWDAAPEGVVTLKGDGMLSDAQLSCFGTMADNSDGITFAFEDAAIGERYEEVQVRERLAAARSVLAELHVLDRLPVYNPQRDGLAVFAHKLERLCGARPGSILRVKNGRIVARDGILYKGGLRHYERASCVINAVIASGFEPYEPILITTPAS